MRVLPPTAVGEEDSDNALAAHLHAVITFNNHTEGRPAGSANNSQLLHAYMILCSQQDVYPIRTQLTSTHPQYLGTGCHTLPDTPE
jgi:hypothetical protein